MRCEVLTQVGGIGVGPSLSAQRLVKQQRRQHQLPVATGEALRRLIEQIQRGGAEQEELCRQLRVVPAFDDARRPGQSLRLINHQHRRVAEGTQAVAG